MGGKFDHRPGRQTILLYHWTAHTAETCKCFISRIVRRLGSNNFIDLKRN